MADTASNERRRRNIHERVAAKDLRGALDAESPTWIPSPYVVSMVTATCHYCDEQIEADEALLVRDSVTCPTECKETWRDLVTGERAGESP
jgi:hypothetical protein